MGFKEPAFFVRHLETEANREDVVELGFRVKMPEEALIEPGYSGPKEFAGGLVRNFHEEHGQITMSVDTPSDSFLVVTASYFPRWQATVDGKETPLYRANGSFLALQVPSGRHEVELVYRPTDHLLLLAISGMILLLVAAYCAWKLQTAYLFPGNR